MSLSTCLPHRKEDLVAVVGAAPDIFEPIYDRDRGLYKENSTEIMQWFMKGTNHLRGWNSEIRYNATRPNAVKVIQIFKVHNPKPNVARFEEIKRAERNAVYEWRGITCKSCRTLTKYPARYEKRYHKGVNPALFAHGTVGCSHYRCVVDPPGTYSVGLHNQQVHTSPNIGTARRYADPDHVYLSTVFLMEILPGKQAVEDFFEFSARMHYDSVKVMSARGDFHRETIIRDPNRARPAYAVRFWWK